MNKINFTCLMFLLLISVGLVAMEEQYNGKKHKIKTENDAKVIDFGKHIKRQKFDEIGEENEEPIRKEGWNSLPIEMKEYIVSFLLNTNALIEAIDYAIDEIGCDDYTKIFTVIKYMHILRSIDKELRTVVLDGISNDRFFKSEAIVSNLVEWYLRKREKVRKNRKFKAFVFNVAKILSRFFPSLFPNLVLGGIVLISQDEAPLVNAICLHRVDRVKELISRGYGEFNSEYGTELTLAAEVGDLELVRLFLETNSSDISYFAKNQKALSAASFFGCKEVVEYLLAKGFEIDCHDDLQKTALIRACQQGHYPVMKVLIKNGAKPDFKDLNGYTALWYAVDHNHKKMTEFLLDNGADINIRNGFSDLTVLMVACCLNSPDNYELAKMLMERGADLNIQSKEGMTALMYAVNTSNKEIVELLLAKGADSSITNNKNQTALMIAEEEINTNSTYFKDSTYIKEKYKSLEEIVQILSKYEISKYFDIAD